MSMCKKNSNIRGNFTQLLQMSERNYTNSISQLIPLTPGQERSREARGENSDLTPNTNQRIWTFFDFFFFLRPAG